MKHLALVAALSLPKAALAQGVDAPTEPLPQAAPEATAPAEHDMFSSLDANADGSVTQEEAASSDMVAQGFTAADTNQDGNLSQEEYNAAFGGAG